MAEYIERERLIKWAREFFPSVLDLINRQKAEIEELKAKIIADDKLLNDRVQEAVNFVSKANQKYVDALEKAFNDKVAELKTAKSEAIKEFAERLKDNAEETLEYSSRYFTINEDDIDNLVKEMEAENENDRA